MTQPMLYVSLKLKTDNNYLRLPTFEILTKWMENVVLDKLPWVCLLTVAFSPISMTPLLSVSTTKVDKIFQYFKVEPTVIFTNTICVICPMPWTFPNPTHKPFKICKCLTIKACLFRRRPTELLKFTMPTRWSRWKAIGNYRSMNA